MDEGPSTTLIMGAELLENPIGSSMTSLLDINVNGDHPYEKAAPDPSISQETDDDGHPKRKGCIQTLFGFHKKTLCTHMYFMAPSSFVYTS